MTSLKIVEDVTHYDTFVNQLSHTCPTWSKWYTIQVSCHYLLYFQISSYDTSFSSFKIFFFCSNLDLKKPFVIPVKAGIQQNTNVLQVLPQIPQSESTELLHFSIKFSRKAAASYSASQQMAVKCLTLSAVMFIPDALMRRNGMGMHLTLHADYCSRDSCY